MNFIMLHLLLKMALDPTTCTINLFVAVAYKAALEMGAFIEVTENNSQPSLKMYFQRRLISKTIFRDSYRLSRLYFSFKKVSLQIISISVLVKFCHVLVLVSRSNIFIDG
jgi:hypothetical protein